MNHFTILLSIYIFLCLSIFLISCNDYYIKETKICTQSKVAYTCIKKYSSNILAICKTELECRKICDKFRKKHN